VILVRISGGKFVVSSCSVMAQGDAREWKCSGNWRMEWVASILHTTSEHGVSSITTADAHASAANSRLNWRPCRFKWTRPFRWKTNSGFCACAITFHTQWYTGRKWNYINSRNVKRNISRIKTPRCFLYNALLSKRVAVLLGFSRLTGNSSVCSLTSITR
jgi:hypothetical protein